VLSSVLVLQWPYKSRSIGLLGSFKDHHMGTFLQFVIQIIAARGSSFSGSSHSKRLPYPIAPTSIQYPNLHDKILSMPQAGSQWWTRLALSGKYVHGFATGFCQSRQEVGYLCRHWIADPLRDAHSRNRQDLQELY